MGAEEEIERIRIQERDRRRALAVYEDADMVEKDGDAAEANQPLMPELPRRQQTTIYKGLKPAKKRKNPSDASKDEVFESSTPANVTSTFSRPIKRELKADSPEYEISNFAPARKGPRAKVPAAYKRQQTVDTRMVGKSSEWYASINLKEKYSRSDLQAVSYINTLCQNYASTSKRGDGETEKILPELRKRLHEMEFYPFLSGVIIKKSRVLEEDGLPRIFDNQEGVEFPWDVRADARALYLRWVIGDLDPHLLRGIVTTKGQLQSGMKRTSHRLDKEDSLKKSANAVGENHLVNGQWWPSHICALRDGAHGEHEAGIHGQAGKGAYSVVVAQGGYADEDKGSAIEYCGTESVTSTPTKNTNLMLEAYNTKQVIRVLRAENKNSPFAPRKGIRYDGLYTVVEYEILREETAMYRFSLRRCKGQDPLRCSGAEVRPTDQELQQYAIIRERLGMTAV